MIVEVNLMDNKAKLKKELMSYGKEEIVSAILDLFGYEYIAGDILIRLHEKRGNALIDAEKKAMDRAKDAMDAYRAWVDSMETDISKMSVLELERGARLLEEIEKAEKAIDLAIERVERFFREGV